MDGIPAFNVVVFVRGCELALVRMEGGYIQSATDAPAEGFTYAGLLGVNDGEPCVFIEAGYGAAMYCAGLAFAGLFGEHVKEHQLKMRDASGRT